MPHRRRRRRITPAELQDILPEPDNQSGLPDDVAAWQPPDPTWSTGYTGSGAVIGTPRTRIPGEVIPDAELATVVRHPDPPGAAVASTPAPVQLPTPQALINLGTVRRAAMFATYSLLVPTISRQIISDNPRRSYLFIQNKSGGQLFIDFGRAARVESMEIAAGGFYESEVAPINSIHMLAAVAGQSAFIIEGLTTQDND